MAEMRFSPLAQLMLVVLSMTPPTFSQQLPNPDSHLEPLTEFQTPVLEFEFPGLKIGTAEYAEGPTGCTVFYFPDGVAAAVDVRGGAPGTVNTDTLRLGYEKPYVDAITLSGGSDYGLEVAAGVSAEILAMRDYSGFWDDIAVVPGAIIFDLQTRRFNSVYPDKRLGRIALRSAIEGRFYQGARGAGRFAMQGSYFGDRLYSGQGGAFRQIGPTRVAVFTVVNSVGTIVDRRGQVVRCSQQGSEGCGSINNLLEEQLAQIATVSNKELRQNTTISLVVTNQKLSYWALKRLAVQVHTSMARAIQPFHTESDGDTLFAASTGAIENPRLSERDLGVLASETAWDAVLNSVPRLEDWSRGEFITLEAEEVAGLGGIYHFGAGTDLEVSVDDERVFVEARGDRAVYGFEPGKRVEILPTSPVDFLRKDTGSPRIQFNLDGTSHVVGMTINPGNWPVTAVRE